MPNNWILKFIPRPNARYRLFCFHHAGGSASAYYRWASQLPAEIEIVAIQLPGRGSRLREPFLVTMPDLVSQLHAAMASELSDRPYGFFGHSMGGLVSFELARRLEAEKGGPRHLFVSAVRAPQVYQSEKKRFCSRLPRAEFIEELRSQGGTPEDVFANQELMDLVLPVIRADYRLVDDYQYEPGPRLSCPIIIFGGEQDPETSERSLLAWGEQTNGGSKLNLFPGGHFFWHKNETPLIQRLTEELTRGPRIE